MLNTSEFDEQCELIKTQIFEAARYEQLAEECTELAKAALKKARKIRRQNYTPLTMAEIDDNLIEEFNDVVLAAKTCDLEIDKDIISAKLQRWIDRVTEYPKE